MEMNNHHHRPLLRFIFVLLIVSLPLVVILTVTNPLWLHARATVDDYSGIPPEQIGDPLPGDIPGANEPGGKCWPDLCDEHGLGTSALPAIGTGWGDGTVVLVENGIVYTVPDPGGDGQHEHGGVGGIWTPPPGPPPVPPPPPPVPETGIITAIALLGNPGDLTTCAKLEQLKSCLDTPPGTGCNATYLSGTQFSLNGWVGPATQINGTAIRFLGVYAGRIWYLTAVYPPGTSSPHLFCRKTTLDPVYSMGESVYLTSNMTADFLVGFGPVLPWFQVQGGGNTYGKTIQSLMPLLLTPALLFDNTAAPATPGIVSSLEGVDFNEAWTSSGARTHISSTNWNTNNAMTQTDWYLLFRTKLLQGTVVPYEGTGGKPQKVEGAAYTVYTTNNYTNGDLTINEPWVVADGEKLIILVEGSLHISSPVNITGNGFVGFVVKDDIVVDNTVGTTWNGTSPVVEGMYIAGKSIKTGRSLVAATERFVGKGIFVANDIILQRDLSTTAHNINTSADLFLYNPAFLVTAPDILKDLSYEWQEVAP